MAKLTTSGQLSLGDVRSNRAASPGTGDNVSLAQESGFFASGSVVGDIDGNPANPGDIADRDALNAAPHKISEFYGADFPSTIITNITFTTEGSDTNTVDGEDLDVNTA